MPVRLEIGHDVETGINVLSTSSINNVNYHNTHIPSTPSPSDVPSQSKTEMSPTQSGTTVEHRNNGYKNKLDLKLLPINNNAAGVDRHQSQMIHKKVPDLTNGNDISKKEYEIETNRLNSYNSSIHSNNGIIASKNGQINYTNGTANLDYNYCNGIVNGNKSKLSNSLSNGTIVNGNHVSTTQQFIEGITLIYHILFCIFYLNITEP